MLCCDIFKVADMIVVSTLPDHLHFYCIYLFKARYTTKQSYKALKFLHCQKYIFVKKSNMVAGC